MRQSVMAGLIALFFTGHASAAWQYTEWGMSSAQVMQSSGGKAEVVPKREGNDIKLVAPYSALGIALVAGFRFSEDGRLNGVELRGADASGCSTIKGELSNLFDLSEEIMLPWTTIQKWWDRENGNVIAFIDFSGGCSVQYQPMGERQAVDGL